MDQIIKQLWDAYGDTTQLTPIGLEDAARRLEECRALLQRLADDEPAPEGHTFQSWARELLA